MKLFYHEKEFNVIESKYRSVFYFCDSCGCPIGNYQPMFCMESQENDFLVFCERCFHKYVVPAT